MHRSPRIRDLCRTRRLRSRSSKRAVEALLRTYACKFGLRHATRLLFCSKRSVPMNSAPLLRKCAGARTMVGLNPNPASGTLETPLDSECESTSGQASPASPRPSHVDGHPPPAVAFLNPSHAVQSYWLGLYRILSTRAKATRKRTSCNSFERHSEPSPTHVRCARRASTTTAPRSTAPATPRASPSSSSGTSPPSQTPLAGSPPRRGSCTSAAVAN
jgi:hypothetical protein